MAQEIIEANEKSEDLSSQLEKIIEPTNSDAENDINSEPVKIEEPVVKRSVESSSEKKLKVIKIKP